MNLPYSLTISALLFLGSLATAQELDYNVHQARYPMSSHTQYEWNANNGKWEPDKENLWHYNHSGLLTRYQLLYWIPGKGWEEVHRQDFDHDEMGRLQAEWRFFTWPDSTFAVYEKRTYAYSDAGCGLEQVITYLSQPITYSYDIHTYYDTYLYDQNCRLLSYQQSHNHPSGGLKHLVDLQYSYINDGTLSRMGVKKNFDYQAHVYRDSLWETYDLQDRRIELLEINHDRSGHRQRWQYDAAGQLTGRIIDLWVDSLRTWQLNRTYTYRYDLAGNQVFSLEQLYQPDTALLLLYQVASTFEYDENGSKTHEWTEIWEATDSLPVEVGYEGIFSNAYFCDQRPKSVELSYHSETIPYYSQTTPFSRDEYGYIDADSCGQSPEALLQIWPNPASAWLTVDCPLMGKGGAQLEIVDRQGRRVFGKNMPRAQTAVLDLSRFTPGLYFVRVQLADKVTGKKLIVY